LKQFYVTYIKIYLIIIRSAELICFIQLSDFGKIYSSRIQYCSSTGSIILAWKYVWPKTYFC